ncbi:PAS domain-containing protein [uncultured Roseobacter sp.]|uniref:PAS domain-containing protein n=1 Tax=uncultured Roseobacter sp. TaxID=114847 RepID=UPI00263749CA|nr:PAS domain-containing protein [uncultured Roseobacter sp.]
MLDDLNLPAGLSPALRAVCDGLLVPVTIADPDQTDMPLVYVNPAFETLTQYPAAEVLGQNCRFLQGPLTDKTATDEIATVCQRRAADSFCLINYRKDGSLFFNLLAIQPIDIGRSRTMLMGCQFAFRPTQTGGTLARTGAMIDRAQRQMRLGSRAGPHQVNIHDTYRLDTIAMRFEAAFTRVKNTLVKNSNTIMREGTALQRTEQVVAGGFAGRDPAHVARLLG